MVILFLKKDGEVVAVGDNYLDYSGSPKDS